MISVALGELNCPSYDYVKSMTWAEFLIRLHAYKRLEKKEYYKVREISYEIHCLNYLFSKKKPPSKEKFMPLDKKKATPLTPKQMDAIMKAREEYFKQKNGG